MRSRERALTCDNDGDVVGVDVRGLVIGRPTDVDTGIGDLQIVYVEYTALNLRIVGQ